MINKHRFTTIFFLLLFCSVSAQTINSDDNSFYKSRVLKAPERVFKMFIDAGMEPTNHVLTESEQEKVEKAFSMLPPLHKKILKEHLQSISFMDNMPNTALTSTLETADSSKKFNITFRAGILHETISAWATWKEKSAFDTTKNPDLEIKIDAGNLDAIQYILLHEATHVVDAVLNLTPQAEKVDSLERHTVFTRDTLLEKTRFRSGKIQPITAAPGIYNALKKTPYPSLYAMASWYEDLAELLTIYHLTNKLNQPFVVYVKENGKIKSKFEPMKGRLVKGRLKELGIFYN